jgi:hypothetical protein
MAIWWCNSWTPALRCHLWDSESRSVPTCMLAACGTGFYDGWVDVLTRNPRMIRSYGAHCGPTARRQCCAVLPSNTWNAQHPQTMSSPVAARRSSRLAAGQAPRYTSTLVFCWTLLHLT